jgi:hypothetical protein
MLDPGLPAMIMMTVDTRKSRSRDLGSADEPIPFRARDAEPTPRDDAGMPFNDNVRESLARRLPVPDADETIDDTADYSDTADEAASPAPRVRRRGPLVTRWIGFAAQRRRARAHRSSASQAESGARSSDH